MIEKAQFHNIKFLKEVEGLSQRQIATKLGISRNTVSKYLKNNTAPTTVLRKNVYGTKEYSSETKRVIPIIDRWLENDLKNWQKHTAIKIFRRLQNEYDFKGSASNIRKIVAKRRQQIQEAFIPLDFQHGHQFQFDWGEADIILQGRNNAFSSSAFSSRPAVCDLPERISTKNRKHSWMALFTRLSF
ncbi:helix-turn-helix domain-containing protein [Peribacillus saganii]|uniref:helix-turn-helix domain-containing protein n=1 Tax=Peribacillus saganii TaxID=2303992 RepID=UPI001F1FCDB7|nr:helix-turn-helix domain-containing protein [Peribacillus saganii]